MLTLIVLVIVFWLLNAGNRCAAWLNHTLIAEQALKAEQRLDGCVPSVPLAEFVLAEKHKIAGLLEEEDRYCARTFPDYRPVPAAVRLQPDTLNRENAKKAFMSAIRINIHMPLNNFIQIFPTDEQQPARADFERIGFVMYNDNGLLPFAELRNNEPVCARRVFSSACDEPDYGLDILLWEDCGTYFGRRYGFGNQPYGPKFMVATQVPVHTDFGEEKLLCSLSREWRRSLLHYRVRLYSQLSRLAFERGQDYWGLRLFGWAAHYICDACQPYHVRPMPGFSVPGMIAKFLLSKIGFGSWYEKSLQDIGNYHLLQEKLLTTYLLDEYYGKADYGFLAAMSAQKNEIAPDHRGDFSYQSERHFAFERAPGIAAAMKRMITNRAVFDDIYNLDACGEYDVFECTRGVAENDASEFSERMKECLAFTALNLRGFCRDRLAYTPK